MADTGTLFRLDPTQLAVVRQRAGLNLSVNSNTTPLEAGFQMGVARVIQILQDGFVVQAKSPERE